MGMAYVYARRYQWPVEEVLRWARVKQTFREAAWAFLLPIIILGGIFGGVVTATEGAALAVLAALFIGGVIYRELNWRHLYDAMMDGVVQTAIVMLLVAASALLGVYLTEQRLPQQLAAWLSSITTNRYAVLGMLNIAFLIVGLFLHSAAAIILVVPIVMPLVKATGIDPVHFGLIVTLNLGIGQQTPPVASVLMASCSIAKADMWKVTRVNLPFIGVLLATLLLVTYVPIVPMGLVDFFYK
jgi:C4-dicarboxylate transporter DctM subunit